MILILYKIHHFNCQGACQILTGIIIPTFLKIEIVGITRVICTMITLIISQN